MRFSIRRSSRTWAATSRSSPGDLIATGTPARLATRPDPTAISQPGDAVTCWIEGIGELTNDRRLATRERSKR